MSYRETLHAWAAQHVPDGASVLSVEIDHEEDSTDPTYGDAIPGHLEVWVSYTQDGEHSRALVDVTSLGEILTQLFAIEDAEARP